MFKEWLDENMTMSDVLIIVIVIAGLIAALLGLKEFFGASIGAATTYLTKDKTKRTQLQEERTREYEMSIRKERDMNDGIVKIAVEKAMSSINDDELDELVAAANKRIRERQED